ncbi:hypothetical protein [Aquimarina sediminis]|uniref:hypothetical protein n=1 Tax=Aquimarina sediminis TaxID=2070536 RepID=UPI000CA04FEF|nr:hypothetical protein [Aquimarina sediminis]
MKKAYKKEIEDINKQISQVKKLDQVNESLRKSNWIFLHPYVQVFEINKLRRIISENDNIDEKILTHFAERFLNLRSTIHFIDGFFATRPFLKDYEQSINESVVLCLQKDFNGAINTLLPIIEGTLRKLLVEKKGIHKESEINIEELLKVFNYLTADYVNLQKEYLNKRYESNIRNNEYFDKNQEKSILKKHREYYELWSNQFVKYLKDNLYANTKNRNIKDSFNRHIMFHKLSDNVDYNFANYLRLFNCIHYLSWAIGSVYKECSILSAADEKQVLNKWFDYFSILTVSESLTETKRNIYKNPEIPYFKTYLNPKIAKLMVVPKLGVDIALKAYNLMKSNEF